MSNVNALGRAQLIDRYIQLLTKEERLELLMQLVIESDDKHDLLFNLIHDSPRAYYEKQWLKDNVESMEREAHEACTRTRFTYEY